MIGEHLRSGKIDISFETPKREWTAKLSKPTINIYLYELNVTTGGEDADSSASFFKANISLTYRVTVFGRIVKDEHSLLSRMLATFIQYSFFPYWALKGTLLGHEVRNSVIGRDKSIQDQFDYWEVLDNEMMPYFDFQVCFGQVIGQREFYQPAISLPEKTIGIPDADECIRLLLINKFPIRKKEISITFETPKRDWTARLSKPTINVHLYDINLESKFRIELTYRISAFAFDIEDEHIFLGKVLITLLQHPILLSINGQEIRTVNLRSDELVPNTFDYWKAIDNELITHFDYRLTILDCSKGAVEQVIVQDQVNELPEMKTKPSSDHSDALKVFLCHSSQDKLTVRELYHRLLEEGFDPWLDEEKLLPGQVWREEIEKSVRESHAVIVCISEDSTDKEGFIQKEISIALDVALEKPEGKIFIIPLKLENCDVPRKLSRWHHVQYFEDKGYDKLIRALRLREKDLGLS
jgi:hypothetical protein